MTLRGISLLALSGYGLQELRRRQKLPMQLLEAPAGIRIPDMKQFEKCLERAAMLISTTFWPRSCFTLPDHTLEKLAETVYSISALAKEATGAGCEVLYSALPELEASVKEVADSAPSYGEIFVLCAVAHALPSVLNQHGLPDSEECRKLKTLVDSCNKSKNAFDTTTRSRSSLVVCTAAGMLMASEALEHAGGLVRPSQTAPRATVAESAVSFSGIHNSSFTGTGSSAVKR